MPDFSLPLEYYLIPFLIIVGICLILIVVFMVGIAGAGPSFAHSLPTMVNGRAAIHFISFIGGTVHINLHFCKCTSDSQQANFQLKSFG